MERVVNDTNVFVAAGFNPRSGAARILTQLRERAKFACEQSRLLQVYMRTVREVNWRHAAGLDLLRLWRVDLL